MEIKKEDGGTAFHHSASQPRINCPSSSGLVCGQATERIIVLFQIFTICNSSFLNMRILIVLVLDRRTSV